MADLEEKNKNLSPHSATAVADAPAQLEKTQTEQPKKEKRAFVSAGERIHHWGTYLSIDWIFNATSGAVFAYWQEFSKTGERFWKKPINWAFTKILSPFLKNEEHLKIGVKKSNTFMSIIAGGMFTLVPLLVLENSKVKKSIVKSVDRVIYGKDKVEHDAKFEKAYDEIEHAPKKDFWTGLWSRLAALAPLLISVQFPKTEQLLTNNVFKHVGNASKVVVSKAGLPPERLFRKHSPEERAKRWKYVHDDAVAMDLSFGLPYAVLHAFFYNMFAGWKDKKKHKHDKDKPVETPQEQLQTPQAETNIAEVTATHMGKVAAKPRASVTPHEKFTDYAETPAEAQVAL